MRKEDRIRQQQSQNSPDEQPRPGTQPHPDERVTGKQREQPDKPRREPGRLPLPE